MSEFERGLELLQTETMPEAERLLADQPGIAETRDPSGVSLLMHALYRRRADLAAAIAAHKQELDLFEAASLGRVDRLADCLRDPAAVNAHSPDGFTALHFACYFGQSEAARCLIQNGADVQAVAANPMRVMPLHSAASARNLEAARVLLEAGAPPNARQHGGWAPSHAAAQNGDRAMVDLLLQYGADPEAANDEGKSALDAARDKGHNELAEYIARKLPTS